MSNHKDRQPLFLIPLPQNFCKCFHRSHIHSCGRLIQDIDGPAGTSSGKLRGQLDTLCLTAGKDTLRLLPPLVITKEEIDKGLAVMAKVMK